MAVAYGSITIVDIGDLGQLSVIPESNQPNTVIYDPNVAEGQQYNPNWATSNLVLTPIIYYGPDKLDPTKNGVTVTWQRKVGNNEPETLNKEKGETTSNGILTVNQNIFDTVSQITYICKVSYNDPSTMGSASLEAQGRITFSLIKNASKIKSVSITGESVFLYDGEGNLVSNPSIKLTATLNSVNMGGWDYKDKDGIWTPITDGNGENITSTTITINEKDNDSYFVNNIATIRVNTTNVNTPNDPEPLITDIHVITKIHDGAPGDQIVSAVLSNDNQMVPCDSKGNPLDSVMENGQLKDAKTKITIYEGSTDVTDEYVIACTFTDLTGVFYNGETQDIDKKYYCEVTGFKSAESMIGSVTFTCTPRESSAYNSTVTKKFTLTKIQPGVDGTSPIIYSLESSALVINKNIAKNYSPSSITLKAYKQEGDKTKEAYWGKFKIIDPNGRGLYESDNSESEHIYKIPDECPAPLTVELWDNGGNTLYDSQTIIIVSDGATGSKGDTGAAGKDAISFVLGNYSDVIPCTNAGLVASKYTITIPYSAYKGTTKVEQVTASCTGTTTDMTIRSTTNGVITIDITSGASLEGKDEGAISITLTAEGVTNTQTYTWTKNKQAADGQDAGIFQVYAPQGNVIVNGENSVELTTKLVIGASTIESGITYQWYKWDGSKYTEINKATSSSLTVAAVDIQSYGSYMCKAVYATVEYSGYLAVYDKTDPIQLQVISSLGDKLVNSVGRGIIYVKVFQNGNEIDKMPTTTYSEGIPSTGIEDAYTYVLLGSGETGTATLYQYKNGAWNPANNYNSGDNKTYSYQWTITQSNGDTSTPQGKVIYLDSDVVNKKAIFDVTVTINAATTE